jgi:hypothetical protein
MKEADRCKFGIEWTFADQVGPVEEEFDGSGGGVRRRGDSEHILYNLAREGGHREWGGDGGVEVGEGGGDWKVEKYVQ